jgi:CNT family concentrative nucleoside transporter
MLQLQSAFGVVALLAIAWGFGENRRAVSLKQAAIGLAATLVTAVLLLKLPVVAHAFGAINDAVNAISSASRAGSSFVFGYVGGGTLPFDLKVPGADFILAFQALPVVSLPVRSAFQPLANSPALPTKAIFFAAGFGSG